MFSLDDHAGNVVTTVGFFAVAAAILYAARVAVLVFLLGLLFAYLLAPAVTLVQQRSPLAKDNRLWAIAQVYLIATLTIGSVLYELGPNIATQMKKLNATVSGLLADLSSGTVNADLATRHGVTAVWQVRIEGFLVRHHEFIVKSLGRAAEAVPYLAEKAIWLLAIPVLAIFFLKDGRQMADAFVDVIEQRGSRVSLKRIVEDVDGMLAKYIRAQLALAALSFLFYSVSMLVLRLPYAVVLGLMGGVLEFLPAVGWIASAAAILTVGFLTHSHWICMAVLLALWRLVQDYVNSPRIMGKNLELHPLTVVFALIVGGQVGGIAGVYLSVPAVAALRIVWLRTLSPQTSSTSRR